MKIQNLFLFSILFIEISKCQNIISPTNYTLNYFEGIDMQQMKCKSDSDCPQYSKCESITDGDKTISICKFGDFLCPESRDDFFTNSNTNESCVYVDTMMYDLDEELIKEGFSKDIKPILKICSTAGECTTEVCNRNSDCLSGMCMDQKCVNGNNMNNEIYRCSVDDQNKYSMKCKKINGMMCRNNSECYSNNCTSQYCFDKEFTGYKKSHVILIFMIILFAILLLIICAFYIIVCIYGDEDGNSTNFDNKVIFFI